MTRKAHLSPEIFGRISAKQVMKYLEVDEFGLKQLILRFGLDVYDHYGDFYVCPRFNNPRRQIPPCKPVDLSPPPSGDLRLDTFSAVKRLSIQEIHETAFSTKQIIELKKYLDSPPKKKPKPEKGSHAYNHDKLIRKLKEAIESGIDHFSSYKELQTHLEANGAPHYNLKTFREKVRKYLPEKWQKPGARPRPKPDVSLPKRPHQRR